MCERKPDTIVISFRTTTDYVVDLATGNVKVEYQTGEDFEPMFMVTFAEGEVLGEAPIEDGEVTRHDLHEDDRAAFERAREILGLNACVPKRPPAANGATR